MLVSVSKETERELYIWNRVEGIKKWDSKKRSFTDENEEAQNPDMALKFLTRRETSFFF
jgi:hypothetical protein